MANESELCVDYLLERLNRIDQLISAFDEKNSTLNSAETLAGQSRDLSRETHSFIENNKTVIPGYILKKVTDSLKKLEARANESGKTKLKFKFNRPAGQSTEQSSSATKSHETKADLGGVGNNNCAIKGMVEKNLIGFRNLTGENNLELNPNSVDSKDVHLINLRNCSVSIRGSTSAVYIRKCLDCQITIFLATRSVTVTECCDVQLRAICQQLRIDSTTRLQLQLFASARSMLESSRDISFEPLENWLSQEPEAKKEVLNLVERANFNMSQNNWKCIDDFDWLSPDRPSANYKLLETDCTGSMLSL